MQWPYYFDPVLDRFRKDLRILAILEPLLGHDLKQIINQPHWKPPGAAMAEFGPSGYPFPPAAFRVPGAGRELCADGYRDRSAPKRERRDVVYPGSHRMGELSLGDGRVMDRPLDEEDLGGSVLIRAKPVCSNSNQGT